MVNLKLEVMQHNPLQLELLLPGNTVLALKKWAAINSAITSQYLSPIKELEQACCQGLLKKLFHEIMKGIILGKRLYQWHIDHCAHVLRIRLCEFPAIVEEKSSINTQFFLPVLVYN
jgi:hypothetical protein